VYFTEMAEQAYEERLKYQQEWLDTLKR
jgi:hypothetical protein